MLNYLRIATDVMDYTESIGTDNTLYSLHFCDNRQAICAVCRQNPVRCFCADRPDDALRRRGLFNSNFHKRLVILGKPNANGLRQAMFQITAIKDLSDFVPSKRSHTIFVVEDGHSPSEYDVRTKLLDTVKYSATYASIPTSIYSHGEFDVTKLDMNFVDFVLRPFNNLKTPNDKITRQQIQCKDKSLLDTITKSISVFAARVDHSNRVYQKKNARKTSVNR